MNLFDGIFLLSLAALAGSIFAQLLITLNAQRFNSTNRRFAWEAGHRLVWVALAAAILFSDLWIERWWLGFVLVVQQLAISTTSNFSVVSLISLSAVPHRTFPLSCSLLS